ncbi:TIGR00296 family protein [Candidatus Bathyarchaeota archaeon]|nr:TIGR00296 family protein [Candidatus Bathyarchaeota archaeon]
MEPEKAVKEARRIIEAHFDGKDYTPELTGRAGVFVTLTKGGLLRGCIGFSSPVELSKGLKGASLSAIRDPRFPPMTKKELGEVEIEVSLLTPPEKVARPLDEIQVGKHGLIVRKGFHSGLLLPQVAVEQGWNVEEFLDGCCLKAGLPEGSWKEAEVYRFEGTVFGEERPRGKVVKRDLDEQR